MYLLLMFMGWANIYSAPPTTRTHPSIFDLEKEYGNQSRVDGDQLPAGCRHPARTG